jgi:hypothetical protein
MVTQLGVGGGGGEGGGGGSMKISLYITTLYKIKYFLNK